MIEEQIEIRTADGAVDGFLYRHEGGGRKPGVIHLTDIGGIRSSQKAMASRLAAAGYTVLMPNLFYRFGVSAKRSPPGKAATRARSTTAPATAGEDRSYLR